jgi:tRNA (guanine-N7-)-methyltransferase
MTTTHAERLVERRRMLAAELAPILTAKSNFVWEVGCGHGHFLTAYAQAHPEKCCIGIDIASDRIRRAVRKRDRAKLANLHFIHAEARLFLDTLPVGARFDELFILFPDPWPKVRHHKHRILQQQFLTSAATHAASDARLFFRTDYQPYFEQALRDLQRHPDWQAIDETWPFEYRTVFQARADTYHSFIARRVTRVSISQPVENHAAAN